MKEPKIISERAEARLEELAEESITHLAMLYPRAREIDLLNAFLKNFTKRVHALNEEEE